MLTPQEKTEKFRQGRVHYANRLTRGLSPEKMEEFKRWLLACKHMDVPVTTEGRIEVLRELSEQ